MEKKKLKIKLETNLPRRKMPPSGKVFKDKKKEENRTRCRRKNENFE